jgi:hypothetical protein
MMVTREFCEMVTAQILCQVTKHLRHDRTEIYRAPNFEILSISK